MNNISTLSEKSLIENCINGNRKSQKELYERFSPKMFAICLRYAQNDTEAENILQNGFVKLFNNLYKLKGYESFEGWVERFFVKTAMEHAKQTKVKFAEFEHLKNIIEVENSDTLDNLYENVYARTSQKSIESKDSVFKLYAVEGSSKNKTTDKLILTQTIAKAEIQCEESLAINVSENKITEKKKKMNFSYTIQKGDCKRLSKEGILRVYHINEPIDIPVGRLLGRWKKEHIGITLVAINGKWCIKGGRAEDAMPKAVVNEPLSFNLLKRLVW